MADSDSRNSRTFFSCSRPVRNPGLRSCASSQTPARGESVRTGHLGLVDEHVSLPPSQRSDPGVSILASVVQGTGRWLAKPKMEVQFLPEASTTTHYPREETVMKITKYKRRCWSPPKGQQRFSDYLQFRRGKNDGVRCRPLASLSEVYLQGYALGRRGALKAEKTRA